jgi:hypothetical protein
VLTVNMGHEEDYELQGENRTARGIISAVPLDAAPDAIGGGFRARRARRTPYAGPTIWAV